MHINDQDITTITTIGILLIQILKVIINALTKGRKGMGV